MKLAIEIDGAAHDTGDRPERDEKSTEWLETQQVEVIRIPAADVINDAASVADAIRLLGDQRR